MEKGKVRLNKYQSSRYAQVYYPSPRAGEKPKVNHAQILTERTSCLGCHDDEKMGYDYVNKTRFMATRHYQAMTNWGVKGPEEACLTCHMAKSGMFTSKSFGKLV